jgi:hypothetical protein
MRLIITLKNMLHGKKMQVNINPSQDIVKVNAPIKAGRKLPHARPQKREVLDIFLCVLASLRENLINLPK